MLIYLLEAQSIPMRTVEFKLANLAESPPRLGTGAAGMDSRNNRGFDTLCFYNTKLI